MFLTFPLMVIRVNPIENIVEWRWWNMLGIGAGSFALSFLWRLLMDRKENGSQLRIPGIPFCSVSVWSVS